MNQQQALADLGVREDTLDNEQKRQLDEQGYLIIEGVLTHDECRAMRAAVDRLCEAQEEFGMEGTTDGTSEMIFGPVVKKDAAFSPIAAIPERYAIALHVLGDVPLQAGYGNFRSGMPGNGLQFLHADIRPVPIEAPWTSVQMLVTLADSTREIGATRFIPGSHLFRAEAHEELDNPAADHPDEISLEAPEGSLIAFNAACWHGGQTNWTDRRRYVMFCGVVVAHDDESETSAHLPALTAAQNHLYHRTPDPALPQLKAVNAHHKPCWCCGMRRTCHADGTPLVDTLERLPNGDVLIHQFEVSTSGFQISEIV
jgi:ectoine hydroxylase-related dioxygenase (phytanoyl-CoA dioxygenase family)